ncbi:MAG: protein phosphatase CheZ [Alphaproteobacteria bacterium]
MNEAAKEQIVGPKEVLTLKKGLTDLMMHIQKIKKEIALIKNPDDHFTEISDELDAVIEATEQATSDIMENSENIDDLVCEIKEKVSDPDIINALDKICDSTSNIIVSCSFQDITGQRVTKVIRAMQYVEKRVNSLISMWGEKAIQSIKVEKEVETDEYKKYLNGPALKGQGVTQDQIDAMLGGEEVAKKTPGSSDSVGKKNVKKDVAAPQTEEKPSGVTINQNDIDALFD